MATTLVDGTVEPEAFRPERLRDPAIHALAARVTVSQDANPDVNALWPQHVVIRLKDGWTWDHVIELPIGHPDNPLSRERNLAKFRKCWRWAGLADAQGDDLVAMVDSLESVADVRSLAALLVKR